MNFSLCFCSSLTSWGWINLLVREEPGSAARDQGSSPSLYRVTHPIPPARFTTVLGAPPALRRQCRDDSPDDDSKWFSGQKWSFECQMLKTRGPVVKLLAAVCRGFGQLTRLLTMKSWRFKMLIETAQITLIVESSFKKGAETLFYSQFYSELHLPNGLCLHQCSVWVLVEVCALRFVGKSKVSIFKKLGISFPTNWTFKGCF